ncbi:hypothetical protein EHV15_04070 [Paenibacillus oralis]|uniref:Uncharacterized protein n=1 Tax=Paenibacillus oralis TaxID=2490856 RepID=A0A3P3TWY6_9BACL|nr:hypothetical protein [Paenibacillus oralis]RRJ62216.1 hypothetical protein EHV15_04070 [Paenibacillus oralis]
MSQWHLKHSNGELYPSQILQMNIVDTKSLHKAGWENTFDWTRYLGPNEVSMPYKLLVIGNSVIQGAIAYYEDALERRIFVDLLESAPTNRHKNQNREFTNVADVLLGEACLQSFAAGYHGDVAFYPKTNLYTYYRERFHAHFGGRGMMFLTDVEAIRLIKLYYK